MQDPEKKKHNLTKRGLKVIGIVLLLGGLTCTVLGSVSLFSSIGRKEFPSLFWMLMIGLPMITIGVSMLMFGFRKEIGTYIKNESVPVVNEAAEELTPAVDAVARAVRETQICPDCGAKNDAELRFCEKCGAPLTKACPYCGEEVGADAAFCRHCRKNR